MMIMSRDFILAAVSGARVLGFSSALTFYSSISHTASYEDPGSRIRYVG